MNKRVMLISAVVVIVLGALALIGAYSWYMSKPEPRGFVHSLEQVPAGQREKAVEQFDKAGNSEQVLGKVVDELGLIPRLDAGDRENAIAILREKSYVELSGDKKGMQFMVRGTRKEKELSEEIAREFYKETVQATLPAKNEF